MTFRRGPSGQRGITSASETGRHTHTLVAELKTTSRATSCERRNAPPNPSISSARSRSPFRPSGAAPAMLQANSATAGALRSGAVPTARLMPLNVALTASLFVGGSWPASLCAYAMATQRRPNSASIFILWTEHRKLVAIGRPFFPVVDPSATFAFCPRDGGTMSSSASSQACRLVPRVRRCARAVRQSSPAPPCSLFCLWSSSIFASRRQYQSLQGVGVERINVLGRHPELESDRAAALNATSLSRSAAGQ